MLRWSKVLSGPSIGCGSLDALVCNAGIGIFGSVEEVPLYAAREQFETNWFGTLRVLRAVLPELRRDGSRTHRDRGLARGPRADPVPGALLGEQGGARRARARAPQRAARNRRSRVADRARRHPHRFNDATDFDLVRDSSYGERVARVQRGDRALARERPGTGDRRARDPSALSPPAPARPLRGRSAMRGSCRSRAAGCRSGSACALSAVTSGCEPARRGDASRPAWRAPRVAPAASGSIRALDIPQPRARDRHGPKRTSEKLR